MSAERWAELRGPVEVQGAPERERGDPDRGQNVWRRAVEEEEDEGVEEEEERGGIHAQTGVSEGLAPSDCPLRPPPCSGSAAPYCSSSTCGSTGPEEPHESNCTENLHLDTEETEIKINSQINSCHHTSVQLFRFTLCPAVHNRIKCFIYHLHYILLCYVHIKGKNAFLKKCLTGDQVI